MKNLRIETITKVCGGTLYGEQWIKDGSKEAEGVVLDSRIMKKDYVFIATRGERVDGHKFSPSVFEQGAMAVICEEVPENLTDEQKTILNQYENASGPAVNTRSSTD